MKKKKPRSRTDTALQLMRLAKSKWDRRQMTKLAQRLVPVACSDPVQHPTAFWCFPWQHSPASAAPAALPRPWGQAGGSKPRISRCQPSACFPTLTVNASLAAPELMLFHRTLPWG